MCHPDPENLGLARVQRDTWPTIEVAAALLLLFNTTRRARARTTSKTPTHGSRYRYGRRRGRHTTLLLLFNTTARRGARKLSGPPSTGAALRLSLCRFAELNQNSTIPTRGSVKHGHGRPLHTYVTD